MRTLVTLAAALALIATGCRPQTPSSTAERTTLSPDNPDATTNPVPTGAAADERQPTAAAMPVSPSTAGTTASEETPAAADSGRSDDSDNLADADAEQTGDLRDCADFAGPRITVLMIGDGMGPEQIHAGRLAVGHALSFEEFPAHGTMTTRSADNEVTDSAASATAMATGHKVDNYVVSQATPGDGSDLETILESYQRCGRRVGMVTTSRLTHATPAAFGAHHSTRWEEAPIFADFLVAPPFDLLVGGGRPGDASDAIAEAGYRLLRSATEFLRLPDTLEQPTMVLIGESHLPYVADDPQQGSGLPALAKKSLELLDDGETPVFLMIEGARIDHAGHNNDFARLWPEVVAFHEAVDEVANYLSGDDRREYLVFVTADHETGGLHDVRRDPETGRLEGQWKTGHHTATEVDYYAIGALPEAVPERIDNTDVYDILRGDWPGL